MRLLLALSTLWGAAFVVVDYNLFANEMGGVSGPPSLEPRIERETYLTLRGALLRSSAATARRSSGAATSRAGTTGRTTGR